LASCSKGVFKAEVSADVDFTQSEKTASSLTQIYWSQEQNIKRNRGLETALSVFQEGTYESASRCVHTEAVMRNALR